MGTHVNRLGDFVRAGKRRLFLGVCVAFVIGIVASTLFTVWLGYRIVVAEACVPPGIGVDTPADLDAVRAVFERGESC